MCYRYQHIESTTKAKYKMRTLAKYIRRFVGLLATSVIGYYRICGHDSLQHKAFRANLLTNAPLPVHASTEHRSTPVAHNPLWRKVSIFQVWTHEFEYILLWDVWRISEDSTLSHRTLPGTHVNTCMKSERDTLWSVKFNCKFRLTRRHFQHRNLNSELGTAGVSKWNECVDSQ